MQLTKPLLFALLASSVASAQIFLNGPVEGFLFDAPTGSLRAVLGVPGSATLGPSLWDGVDFASVAPRQSYAFVFQAGQCQIVSNLNSAPTPGSVISGLSAQPQGVSWSADGRFAILYSTGGNSIQTVSGLPSAPVLASVDISSLPGTLSAVASDPQGKRIAIAVSGATGGLYLTSDSQSFVPVLQAPNISALSFSADGSSLYALDNSIPELAVVDLNTLSSQTLPLDGLSNPVAISADKDAQGRQIVYIASGSDQLLRIVDVASQQKLADLSLNAAPAGLDVLGVHSFVIAARADGTQPLWLFASSPQPAAYFVPALQSIAGGLQ